MFDAIALTFPTERVTNTISKVQIVLLVREHQIAGQERLVVLYEDLRDDLLFGLLLVGVTKEIHGKVRNGYPTSAI